MKTTRLVLETIRDLGGEAFFNLPGRGIYPLLNELAHVPELRYVNGLHEFAVTTAADGYARASGKAGFVNLYMSTGVMNATSAMFMAYRDRVPMVVTASQTESWGVGAHSRAECDDILSVVRPVTKWAWEPPSAARVQEALIRAYTIAMTPPFGPTFLTLPLDFLCEEVEYKAPKGLRQSSGGTFVAGDLVEAAAWLAAAKRPVLVIGGEAVLSGVAEAAQSLARLLGATIVAEPDPPFQPTASDDPLYAGEIGWIPELIEQADVILYLGVNTLEPFDRELLRSGPPKRHLCIGTDPLRFNENVELDWVLAGGLRAGVEALIAAIQSHATGNAENLAGRQAHLRTHRDRWRGTLTARLADPASDGAMTVAAAFAALRGALPQDTLVVEQCTTVSLHFRQHFQIPSCRHYIASSGSNQGWAIGAAVGAKVARPDQPVVAVVGDGTFMFGAQGLFSAVKYDAPVIYVVVNNGGWSSMRMGIDRAAPDIKQRNIDLGFEWDIDFSALAKSFGASGMTASTPDALVGAVKEALQFGTTCVIDARCRREVLHRLN